MNLLTHMLKDQLLCNWKASDNSGLDTLDHKPVVKLFTPDAQCTWLLTELNPADADLLWGLCDLGQGSPELGYVSLAELKTVRGKLGLPIERDLHFHPDKTLSQYVELAQQCGRIVA